MGNACYYSVEKLLSSSLLSKNLKVRIYKTVILPVLLYGCETWTLTLREEHRLRVFENKVLRKIFGAKRDEVTGEWRKLHNTELHALYSSPDIIRNLKSRRLRWAGHVARMGESRNAYRVLVGRPEGKRPLGRPRRRWEDNIKMDLREVGTADSSDTKSRDIRFRVRDNSTPVQRIYLASEQQQLGNARAVHTLVATFIAVEGVGSLKTDFQASRRFLMFAITFTVIAGAIATISSRIAVFSSSSVCDRCLQTYAFKWSQRKKSNNLSAIEFRPGDFFFNVEPVIRNEATHRKIVFRVGILA
ncbi:hypothetical protein ANN_16964 [Periplaneta americana]|uniref:Uncharacterized protein n=1 Tax=Periplaneta americana TaxID=6978 RepID=A0ABQ8ST10_PERAM|nr:hypothetical protein ANN_16964 [Periplaneta americana]